MTWISLYQRKWRQGRAKTIVNKFPPLPLPCLSSRISPIMSLVKFGYQGMEGVEEEICWWSSWSYLVSTYFESICSIDVYALVKIKFGQTSVLCIFTRFCEQTLTKLGENMFFSHKNQSTNASKTVQNGALWRVYPGLWAGIFWLIFVWKMCLQPVLWAFAYKIRWKYATQV